RGGATGAEDLPAERVRHRPRSAHPGTRRDRHAHLGHPGRRWLGAAFTIISGTRRAPRRATARGSPRRALRQGRDRRGRAGGCHSFGCCLVFKGKHQRKEKVMRVFVAGATGALGRHLVPGLVAAGHEVTATTRTPGKAGQLRAAGAAPVVVDGLDRGAVIAAVLAAAPEVIVHQMTALAGLRGLRNPDKAFAVTNELRTPGTGNLLAAPAAAGTPPVLAHGAPGPGPGQPSQP